MANEVQKSVKSRRIEDRARRLRKILWPDISNEQTWDRKRSAGFTTIPRMLALIGTIADQLAEKNKRVSATYWGLWCRVWDTGVISVESEYELATEAGFTGERRVYTWRDRVKQLASLGFIQIKAGGKGPYQHVLILNPYRILCDQRRAGNIQDEVWFALVERMEEIGAKDIRTYAADLIGEGE